jgi:hypothetical protein
VAEVLELAHLVQQHRMAQVQVGRGGVEAGLDPQRAAFLQARTQILELEDLVGTAADQGKGFFNRGHVTTPGNADSCVGC